MLEMTQIDLDTLSELSSPPERKGVESITSRLVSQCKVGSLEAVAKVWVYNYMCWLAYFVSVVLLVPVYILSNLSSHLEVDLAILS